ncbi:insulinase family protein [Chitinophaga horti]|uniref:Insulinase family protein n=1 Tax=Chitinophaga horti TaxID=2920382 RepID=A0ABY6J040_9BACT|nr:insulinase family protein [Chitinophaga horti]UYQ92990.1 insulinase family protein [Chitinophaga horti]
MKMFKLLFITLFAGAVNVSAQSAWKEATSGGYTYKYIPSDPMKARFYTLKNGLTVILSVNNKEPRIQTLIGTRAGSNSDPADHTGLAHYLEHLLFKGTSMVRWTGQRKNLTWTRSNRCTTRTIVLPTMRSVQTFTGRSTACRDWRRNMRSRTSTTK